MHILLIKTSSMGDLIHTLPALTDAMNAIPNLEIDWVVESAFTDIPTWHPIVKKIIPINLRRWRKNIFKKSTYSEIKKFTKNIRAKQYDFIIDAQGLLKSAIVAKCARGKIHGFDKNSAREFYSSYFYNYKYKCDKTDHAVTRMRHLFSQALKYPLPNTQPNFHIDASKLPVLYFQTPEKYFVFLHGTTWKSKHYPENYWRALIEKANAYGITVFLLWGNEIEKNRAERLANNISRAIVLPQLSIAKIAVLLKNAVAVVAVDTGLGHLSAALTTTTISLYGATNPKRIGTMGENKIHLVANFPCAPCKNKICFYAKTHKTDIVPACYETIAPDRVWKLLMEIPRANARGSH